MKVIEVPRRHITARTCIAIDATWVLLVAGITQIVNGAEEIC